MDDDAGAIAAGWYPDSEGTMRWWNGDQWTEDVQEPTQRIEPVQRSTRVEPESEHDSRRRMWLVATLVGLLTFFLGLGIGGRGSPEVADDPAEATSASGATSSDLDQRETDLKQREGDVTKRQEELDQREEDAQNASPGPTGASTGTGSIGNGVFQVGNDVQPGQYKSEGPDDPTLTFCSYRVSTDEAGDDIVASETSQGPGVITLAQGQYFSSQNCKEWTLQ